MESKTRLGRTGLSIHPIGLGANKIGHGDTHTNTEYGGRVVEAGIEKGMNFIDTAFMYGKGLSEEIIGRTLNENKLRDKVVLATKGAHEYKGEDVVYNNRPEFLHNAVDESLRRLQTDVIDLYYIHFPDEKTPKYEAIGALQRLKEDGKIRAIGVSNFSPEQLKEANQDGYLDVVQGHYNLINRSAEKEFFPYLLENDISFVPYFPFASGLLAGKYKKDTPLSDSQKRRPHFQGATFLNHLEKVDKIREIADRHNADVAHIVLSFYLTKKPIDAVIPGARNTEQVVNNLKAAEVELSKEDRDIIEQLYPVE